VREIRTHAGFDEAGAGNRLTVRIVRHSQRNGELTDRPDLWSSGASPRTLLMSGGGKRGDAQASVLAPISTLHKYHTRPTGSHFAGKLVHSRYAMVHSHRVTSARRDSAPPAGITLKQMLEITLRLGDSRCCPVIHSEVS
jgi:hypothetical protein